jgi:hypothetical protein
MRRPIWVDPRVDLVTPEAAAAYLERRGWRRKPFPRPEVMLYEGPLADDGERIDLAVPAKAGGSRYPLSIEELIGSLAVIENRGVAEILGDILAGPSANGERRAAKP